MVITKRLSPQIPADIRQYKTTKSGRGSLLRIPARFGFRVVLKILDLLESPFMQCFLTSAYASTSSSSVSIQGISLKESEVLCVLLPKPPVCCPPLMVIIMEPSAKRLMHSDWGLIYFFFILSFS